MANLNLVTPDLEARARTGDLDAIDALAEAQGDDVEDMSTVIACVPLNVAPGRHPEWTEAFLIEHKDKKLEMPFIGYVGRLGLRTWEWDDDSFSAEGKGRAGSRDGAIAKLLARVGVV